MHTQILFAADVTSLVINKLACYQNPDKATCINLILTDCTRSFPQFLCNRDK